MVYLNIKIGNTPRPEKVSATSPFIVVITLVLWKLELVRQQRRYSNIGTCRLFLSLESGHCLES